MEYVTIGLSDELLAALASPSGDLSRAALEALATEAYREGKISHSQLRRLLGLQTGTDVDAFLKNRGVERLRGWMDGTSSSLCSCFSRCVVQHTKF